MPVATSALYRTCSFEQYVNIGIARLLPLYTEWLRSTGACLVVIYCPVLCAVARFAAVSLNIPNVSLLTAAGPGYWDAAFAAHGMKPSGLVVPLKKTSRTRRQWRI